MTNYQLGKQNTWKLFKSVLHRFITFQRCHLHEWIYCMWGQMNPVGKLIFLPVTVFGLFLQPVIMPVLWCVLTVLTWKPSNTYQSMENRNDRQ